jgi:hypothetical protein
MAVSQATEGEQCQLFWSTTFSPISEGSSVRVPLIGDGEMHTYRFDVGSNTFWRALVNHLRFDPCSTPDVVVKIDYIRALP